MTSWDKAMVTMAMEVTRERAVRSRPNSARRGLKKAPKPCHIPDEQKRTRNPPAKTAQARGGIWLGG